MRPQFVSSMSPWHASFVRAPAGALGDRTENEGARTAYAERSESGKRRNPAVRPLNALALDRERHLARPSHRLLCHRCEQPLRVVPPTTGWVTALAGLLARGSLPGRPAFPVSQWLTRTTGSPLTVAGAATDSNCNLQPNRVPSCLPGANRGTSTGTAFRATRWRSSRWEAMSAPALQPRHTLRAA